MKLGLLSVGWATYIRSNVHYCPNVAMITRALLACRNAAMDPTVSYLLGDDARSRRSGLSKARRV